MIWLSIAVTASIFTFISIYKDDIVQGICKYKKRKRFKKYMKSELYQFQRNKVLTRMIKYYTRLGYTCPIARATRRVNELERKGQVVDLYQMQRIYGNYDANNVK